MTAWLSLLTLAGVITALLLGLSMPTMLSEVPEAPPWVLWSKAALAAANLVCLLGVWTWKRWGVWGLGVSAAGVFVVNGISGFPWGASAAGFAGFGVLLLLVLFHPHRRLLL